MNIIKDGEMRMKKLEFKIIDENMGAQYHHYLLGIILQNENNWKFVFNNYMRILVKHYANCHGDFCFDGIYSVNHNILQELIIRGPVEEFHNIVKKCIDHELYVVLNINEQMLPYRRAYNQYYFRHDIIIYGYDEGKREYITAGFNEEMKYCEQIFTFKEIEKAYYSMKNEWDYEFFLFSYNEKYVAELDLERIKKELKYYVKGENANDLELDALFAKRNDTYYVNNSYNGYYGIEVYTYLIEQIKKQINIFNKQTGVCVNDLRTLNVLKSHISIIKKFTEDYIYNIDCKIRTCSEIEDIIKSLHMISALFMRCGEGGDVRTAKKIINLLQKCKKKEKEVIHGLIKEVI